MIIVFGSLNIDLVMPVDHFPKPGETVLCSTDYLSRPGGKGANQAVAAVRAGAKVAFVGKVGDDAFGRRAVNNLKTHSIWTSGIGISERPTGCATIAVDSRGANIVMVAPGANLDATSDQLPDEILTDKNILLTQMETLPAETFETLKRARSRGALTIFNASPAADVPKDVLEAVDYLIVNELEAQQLGNHLDLAEAKGEHGVDDPPALARALAALGNLTCIITLESRGSVAARPDGATYAVGALQVDVVDTTGAGDTFCGVFSACLQTGHTWLSALHLASIGASLSCLGMGAQAETPVIDDIVLRIGDLESPQKIA